MGFILVSNDELGLKMDAETAAMLNTFMTTWKMAKRKRKEATKEPPAGRNAAWPGFSRTFLSLVLEAYKSRLPLELCATLSPSPACPYYFVAQRPSVNILPCDRGKPKQRPGIWPQGCQGVVAP